MYGAENYDGPFLNLFLENGSNPLSKNAIYTSNPFPSSLEGIDIPAAGITELESESSPIKTIEKQKKILEG